MEEKDSTRAEIRKNVRELIHQLQDNKPTQAVQLDSELEAAVAIVSSSYSRWILADFDAAEELEKEQWSVFTTICTPYRKQVEQDMANDSPDYDADYRRMERVTKLISTCYKEYIKRTMEVHGASDEVKQLIPLLRLDLPETSVKQTSESIERGVCSTIKTALCRLGDLSRYRTTLDKSCKVTDHSHARVYYHAASSIAPDDGTPANQLANLAVATKDYFGAFYWFLRSQVVEVPFAVDNVKRIARKISHLEQEELMQSAVTASDGEPKAVIMSVLWMYAMLFDVQFSQKRRPVGDYSSEIVSVSAKLRYQVEQQRIPAKLLVKIALTGPMVSHLALMKESGEPVDAVQVVNLSMAMFGALIQAALTAAQQNPGGNDTDVPMGLIQTLPALRIYYDWYSKFAPKQAYKSADLMDEITLLANCLKNRYGLKFDPDTAVPASSHDAFNSLEEEKACLGIVPLDGGLSDTPSGVDVAKMCHESVARFQAQCILFSFTTLARRIDRAQQGNSI